MLSTPGSLLQRLILMSAQSGSVTSIVALIALCIYLSDNEGNVSVGSESRLFKMSGYQQTDAFGELSTSRVLPWSSLHPDDAAQCVLPRVG